MTQACLWRSGITLRFGSYNFSSIVKVVALGSHRAGGASKRPSGWPSKLLLARRAWVKHM